jgi:hypothetical protein
MTKAELEAALSERYTESIAVERDLIRTKKQVAKLVQRKAILANERLTLQRQLNERNLIEAFGGYEG